MIDFRMLIQAGVHFGHQSSRWCPRMAPYIWGQKGGVHLIDVSKTAAQLEKAAKFLESVAAEGKAILWVGTKKPAQATMQAAASLSRNSFVTHRWIGGTLTNNSQVKKSITKYLHLMDVLEKSSESSHYTKKELNSFQKRIDRLKKNIGGIVDMKWPIGAVVVVDVKKEHSAVKEAAVVGIPVIALVDTNSDPSDVSIVIPGNDDAPRAINVVVEYLASAAQKGADVADQRRKEESEREKALLGEKRKEAAVKATPKKETQATASEDSEKAEVKKTTSKKTEESKTTKE